MVPACKLPSLIAIAGRKRSGKGTAAQRLVFQHGYELVKFANPLKAMLRTFFQRWGADEETIERLIEGDLKEVALPVPRDVVGFPECLYHIKMSGKSARHAMQTLGTEWRDLINVSLWWDMVEAEIRNGILSGKRIVVDDMRFMHEVEGILSLGGTLLKVTNNRLPAPVDGHVSEQELPDALFCKIIANDGSFEELYDNMDMALSAL